MPVRDKDSVRFKKIDIVTEDIKMLQDEVKNLKSEIKKINLTMSEVHLLLEGKAVDWSIKQESGAAQAVSEGWWWWS